MLVKISKKHSLRVKYLQPPGLDYGVSGLTHQVVNLPRAVSLFMNTRNEVLKEKETRKKLSTARMWQVWVYALKWLQPPHREVANELPGVVGQLEKQGIKSRCYRVRHRYSGKPCFTQKRF